MEKDVTLTWEWPANRSPEQTMIIQIKKVETKTVGFFGIKNSPSFADSLSDPVVVIAHIIDGPALLNNKTVKITFPKLEIEGLTQGSYAVLGIIKHDTCICIKEINDANMDIKSINCTE